MNVSELFLEEMEATLNEWIRKFTFTNGIVFCNRSTVREYEFTEYPGTH